MEYFAHGEAEGVGFTVLLNPAKKEKKRGEKKKKKKSLRVFLNLFAILEMSGPNISSLC